MLDAQSPEPTMQETLLLQRFNDDIGLTQKLLELVEHEFKALGERDIAQLETILADKLPILSQLISMAESAANALKTST